VLKIFGLTTPGTDTVNSLRSPASANNLFSVRPTRGLISRAGIIPISYTQDAVGPIARNVKDLATALTVMASIGYDVNDNATALIPPSSRRVDYSTYVNGGSLKGLRLGVIQSFFNRTASNETTPVNNVMDSMISKLTTAGAVIISINSTIYNAAAISASLDVQTLEYRQAMDTYLSMPSLGGTHPTTLNQLYHSDKFLVIPSQYSYVLTSLASSPANASYPISKLGIQNLITALRNTFTSHALDAVIYPEQKNLVVKIGSPSQSGRNGILAALTGSPVVTIPAGFSNATADAPIGVPVGMEILGAPWSEGKLLNIASLVEGLSHVRRMPEFANGSVEVGVYSSVPLVRPDAGNIPAAYPVGVL
jgi:Asp-tRNA(Asn)/Glu-tRNA(Gln) amidotransferase A subunit family amidase